MKITKEEMHNYGYLWDGMTPYDKEDAIKLFEENHSVMKLFSDNSECYVEDMDDLLSHNGLFGLETCLSCVYSDCCENHDCEYFADYFANC